MATSGERNLLQATMEKRMTRKQMIVHVQTTRLCEYYRIVHMLAIDLFNSSLKPKEHNGYGAWHNISDLQAMFQIIRCCC